MYLQISPAESLRRALVRDTARFGSPTAIRDRYEARYLPGQQLYQAHAAPAAHADVLLDHELPQAPGSALAVRDDGGPPLRVRPPHDHSRGPR